MLLLEPLLSIEECEEEEDDDEDDDETRAKLFVV